MEIFDPFFLALSVLWSVFAATWWLTIPVVLFLVFKMLWLLYIRILYAKTISWVMLEVKIPKNIETTPKAMEQVFASLAAIYSFGVTFYEKWWGGKIQDKISFEIVGYAGGVYFFVRTPAKFRNLVEAAIYAQYPGAEIRISDDYTEILPGSLPNQTYDIFGMDLVLVKDDAYPIRTYEFFEDKENERRLDPISVLTEVMSKLKEGEMIWIQLIIEPDGVGEWKKKGELLIQKLIGAEPPKNSGFGADIIDTLATVFSAALPGPAVPAAPEKKESPNKILSMTQGQKDVVEGVERKLSKAGFKTTLRFLYVDHRDRFSRANVAAVSGAFSQFSTMHLNGFKPEGSTMTTAKGLFKAAKLLRRKRDLYRMYKTREFSLKTCILNTEELATVYHYPTMFVGAPKLQRIEAKKGEPPPNLPIE